MTALTFATEALSPSLLAEALPLLEQHWAEVAHYPDIPLDVDEEMYMGAAAAGLVRCYTVRAESFDRRWLMGYAVFFVRPSLHYKASTQAVQDVIYLAPHIRGGTGVKFLAFCEEQLAAEGVQVCYHHAKLAHGQLGGALQKLGYEPVETMYAKRLDQWTGLFHSATQVHSITSLNAKNLDGGHTPASPAGLRAQHADAAHPWSSADEANDLARTSLVDFSETMQALAAVRE